MWPFSPKRSVSVSTRRSESAKTDRDDFLRDRGAAGPQGVNGRGITDAQRALAVRKSRREYDKAAVYGGVLDRFIDFVYGDGIVIKAKDEAVDTWLQDQLGRGWYGKERKHVENLFIDGENLLVLRALSRGEAAPTGNVRIGTRDPLEIGRIHVNRFDQDDVAKLEVREQEGALATMTLPVVRDEAPAAPVFVPGTKEGEPAHHVLGVFWRVNARAGRGVPVLLRTLDHASDLDNLVGMLVAQLEYARRLWIVARIDMEDDSKLGKDSKFLAAKKNLKEWAAAMEPGEVAVLNGKKEDVSIDVHAPKLELADAKALYDVVLEMCLGGHGIPKMWFGGGGDTNRAVATEQGTPIFRAIQSRQADVRVGVEQLVRALLTMGEAAGVAGVTAQAEFDVTMSNVATRDSERETRELTGLLMALDQAVTDGVLTDLERRKIGRQAFKSRSHGDQLEDTPEPAAAPKPALALVPPAGAAPATTEPAAAPVEKVADAALNGAQVASLVEILQSVTRGEMALAVAIEVLTTAFPSVAREKAQRMVEAAAAFTPPPPAAPAPLPKAG